MKNKIHFYNIPSIRLTFRYSAVAIILIVILALIIPYILNYAPGSINTSFDIEMSYISYSQQFTLISLCVLFLLFIISRILLRDIDKWYKLDDSQKFEDKKLINKIRKKCFNLPYIIFAFEVIVPLLLSSFFLLFATGSHHQIMVIKILLLIICICFLVAIYSLIIAKNIYSEILAKTYSKNINIGFRVSLWKKILFQIIPLFITVIFITSLLGYSRTVAEKEDIYFNIYNRFLTETFDKNEIYDVPTIYSRLNSIKLLNKDHSKFIILEDQSIVTLYGPEVSEFVKKYTLDLSEQYNGRTYDSYGIDTQGSTLILKTSSGVVYIGILFSIDSASTLIAFSINYFVLSILVIFIIYMFGKSLSHDIAKVSDGLKNIKTEERDVISKLPVVSNDEIGDLVMAFNDIQELQNKYLLTIQDNQSRLIEKERLASLGQMIGGIAHNLKTPIMSIAGAAEGLMDLTKEYDISIGDPSVTNEDHHAIVKDMNEWIEKIQTHTSYMSDIITAVKGQAVAFSENATDSFTVKELLTYVDVLMKHELKNALVSLNVVLNVPETLSVKGNINSLVQVLNNIISNAIQAYKGAQNQKIDFTIQPSENSLLFTVQDYGCGMPKNVQEKLFKEMITTKGKNGTGLGLFMSYSNIRAHFNGNIDFESEEGKGTKFEITIPLR